MTTIYTASIYYRPEKPFGVGRTAKERHSRIVGGWRGEVIGGLDDGRSVYTGVHADRDAVKRELVDHLKRLGLSGTLRFS
jgi:hypothetical protein